MCLKNRIIYKKCVALTHSDPNKKYLERAERDFKKRYYNHQTSFKNMYRENNTILHKYALGMQNKDNEYPVLQKEFRSIQTLRKSWCCVSKKNLRLINNLIQKIIEQTFGTNFQMPSPKQVFVVLSPSPAKILGSATVTECFNCIDYFFQPLT